MNDLMARVERLERQNRRLRTIGAVALIAVGCAFALGADKADKKKPPPAPDGKFGTLFAQSIVVGTAGEAAVFIRSAGNRGAEIKIVDADNKDRVVLSHTGKAAFLKLSSASGANVDASAIDLAEAEGGQAMLALSADSEVGKDGINFFAREAASVITVRDPKGTARGQLGAGNGKTVSTFGKAD